MWSAPISSPPALRGGRVAPSALHSRCGCLPGGTLTSSRSHRIRCEREFSSLFGGVSACQSLEEKTAGLTSEGRSWVPLRCRSREQEVGGRAVPKEARSRSQSSKSAARRLPDEDRGLPSFPSSFRTAQSCAVTSDVSNFKRVTRPSLGEIGRASGCKRSTMPQ